MTSPPSSEELLQRELGQLAANVALFVRNPEWQNEQPVRFLDQVADLVDEAIKIASRNASQDRLGAAAQRACIAAVLCGLQIRTSTSVEDEATHALQGVFDDARAFLNEDVAHEQVVRDALRAAYSSLDGQAADDACMQVAGRIVAWVVALLAGSEFVC
jgi:hypothetical protein